MAKKILRDLSFSSIQVILNQLFGLLIFYLTSRYLDKETFGELNWSIATASVIVTLLTFGLDIIVVRRIAGGESVKRTGGLHVLHTLMGSVIFVGILFLARHFFPYFFLTHFLLTGISISLILTFLASPFRQIANGKEAFADFAIMTITGNVIKGCLLFGLVLMDILSARAVIYVFIAASLTEWIIGISLVYFRLKTPIRPYWNKTQYKSLVSESLPQLGVIVFDSALARVDWIILGIVAGSVVTAEYSFAYKIFEISRLPMLIIAPIILPKFIRYLGTDEVLSTAKKQSLRLLLRFETAVAVLIPVFFNLTWTPLMNFLSQGKYGTVNEHIYMLISLAVPLHYFTNFLWTMALAQRQIKLTFYITAAISIFNIVLNLILIPKYASGGAAVAFIASTVLQLILYKKYVNQEKLNVPVAPLLKSMGLAVLSTILAKLIFTNVIIAVTAGILLYILFAIVFKLIRWRDIQNFRILLTK